MLNLARFPTQFQYNVVLHNSTVKLVQFPPKFHFSNLNFGDVLAKTRTGLSCNALGIKKKGGFDVKEMEGSDEFDDEDFDDEFSDMDDGGGGSDEDEVVIPLKNMRQWMKNRPRGFGEGKVYDTTIEDKLVEEIEQSRKAQLANLNKLKNNPSSRQETSKKDNGLQHSHDVFRVRLVNLPKKKNIHRDLRAAFQGVSGITNIVPVVSGNEKTRDPVCKGIAFVEFKNKDEAQRFVQKFSGKPIFFGKVEKKIKCEMVNPQVPKPECDQKSDLNADEDRDVDGSLSCSSEESDDVDEMLVTGQWEEEVEEEDVDERLVTEQWEEEEDGEDGGIDNCASTTSDAQKGEESAIISSSLKQTRRAKKNKKKVASTGNTRKLTIPGSAKKLKIREQALLSGVFSKYGTAATVNEPGR